METEQPEADLKGIGGWLVLVPIQLTLHTGYLLWSCRRLVSHVAELHPEFAIAAVVFGVLAIMLPWVGFIIYSLVRLFQKRRNVPLLMTIVYGLMGILVVVYGLGYGHSSTLSQPLHPLSLALQFAVCVAWIGYFQASVRVKNTFVNAGPSRIPRAEPTGIGGWLVPPLVLLSAWTLMLMTAFIRFAPEWPGKLSSALQHHSYDPLRWLIGVTALAAAVACLVMIFQKRRLARWFLTANFAAITLAIASVGWSHPKDRAAAMILGSLSLAIVVYSIVSKRVKNTFVR